MKLGRVIGHVWADRKVPQLEGCRLHIVQPVNSHLKPCGRTLVAADPRNLAGPQDLVVLVTSTDAAQAFDTGFAPVNASIVLLVSSVE